MRLLYLLGQCSWGALQSLAGLVVFLLNKKAPHFWFRGALVTRWPAENSLSLGLFIFVSDRETEENARRLLVHEYGHTFQSLLLGPLYLLAIGLPSVVWCNHPAMIRRRRERSIRYSDFYTERWANRLGERMTREKTLNW